mmetsp:Transcript_60349/g.139133  ORF Transcript_60349/g.139133 Transcript_60349/m.139133 type:complete len:278 (-) Transcript_60349:830-1663(-)
MGLRLISACGCPCHTAKKMLRQKSEARISFPMDNVLRQAKNCQPQPHCAHQAIPEEHPLVLGPDDRGMGKARVHEGQGDAAQSANQGHEMLKVGLQGESAQGQRHHHTGAETAAEHGLPLRGLAHQLFAAVVAPEHFPLQNSGSGEELEGKSAKQRNAIQDLRQRPHLRVGHCNAQQDDRVDPRAVGEIPQEPCGEEDAGGDGDADTEHGAELLRVVVHLVKRQYQSNPLKHKDGRPHVNRPHPPQRHHPLVGPKLNHVRPHDPVDAQQSAEDQKIG